MTIRDFNPSDIPTGQALFKKQGFNFPRYETILSAGIVEGVGIGVVRRLYEVILALDENTPLRDRVAAIKLLMAKGVFESEKLGVKEWHAFISDPRMLPIVRKIGFKPVEGESLILQW